MTQTRRVVLIALAALSMESALRSQAADFFEDARAKGGQSQTVLDRYFATGFRDFQPPDRQGAAAQSVSRVFPGRTTKEAWTAALLVLMQDAILVYASIDDGIIVCANSIRAPAGHAGTQPSAYIVGGVPEIVLVDADVRGARVSAGWFTEWHRLADRSEVQFIDIKGPTKDLLAARFFELLDREISAASLARRLN